MYFKNIKSYVKRQSSITACLNLGELVAGYGVAWPAPVIVKLQSIEQTPLPRTISETESPWIATCVYFGIFGAYVAGYITNIIGRRPCFIIGGIMKVISYGFLASATSLGMIYGARFLLGISTSIIATTTAIYLGEIASPNIRGILLTSTGVFHALGCLVAYSIGPFVSYAQINYVPIGIGIIYVICTFFIPESPVYYVIKGNQTEATKILRLLGRSEDINKELIIMTQNMEKQENKTQLWRQMFTVKSNLRSLFVTLPLFFFQQASGIIAIIFFATTIFKSAGSSIEPDVATIIVGATMFIGTIFSPMIIEKYGRRILLIVSTSGCCVSMTILGAYFYLDKTNPLSVSSFRWLPLASLVLALFSYSVGLTIIPITLSGEVFGTNVRGLGSSMCLFTGWISGFISATIFGYLVVYLGSDMTFWLFAIINAAALIFVIGFVPETKGKTLTQIDAMMIRAGNKIPGSLDFAL